MDEQIMRELAKKVMFVTGHWYPLTSITNAWMIVDHMRERGSDFSCRLYADHSTVHAEFSRKMPDRIPVNMGIADTMPRAICLAALGALGVGE